MSDAEHPHPQAGIEETLASLTGRRLLRRIHDMESLGGKMEINGQSILNLASNDYLNLGHHPLVIQHAKEALDKWGTGATASRLVCGGTTLHRQLEQALASLKNYEDCLLFGSGALANIGVVTALASRTSVIFADKLVHATMIDGATQSRATLRRFRHNDCNQLADMMIKLSSQRKPDETWLILTESIYSMDGDCAPLAELADLAQKHSAILIVDEAHAMGVYGPNGSGLVHAQQLQSKVPVLIGTLSKALAGYGGFASTSSLWRNYLINCARTVMFSTALPPASVGAALGALTVLKQEPDLGRQLLERAHAFRTLLENGGLTLVPSQSQIVPVLIGDNQRVMAMAETLRSRGIMVAAIREPAVPPNTARLRLSITLSHSASDLEHAAGEIIAAARQCGGCLNGGNA